MCIMHLVVSMTIFFFFNDTATTEIYTLSLHDALPTWRRSGRAPPRPGRGRRHHRRHRPVHVRGPRADELRGERCGHGADRKSTRLNSSHANISYAVFCLKKKNKITYKKAEIQAYVELS